MAQNRRYSDWAQHYGAAPDDFLIEDTPAGEIVHSGLAPTHPNISVSEYWGTWQPPAGSLPTPGNDELDRLFHHEAEQMRRMNGAKTWQLWAFAEDLYGDKIRSMRGTNREVDNWDTFSQSSLLQVDESKWPKYVGKHKWLELEINPLDSIPNPHPSLVAAEPKFWCMRNPVIWQHMRVSIELTVRLFRNLIDEESAWCVPRTP
ncbi:hypothetical protein F4778DRAFT_742723 [Xylariomycetidae sp. FL2044]|nr:hypothetical protein F4778DRAFT_742723 [Xylariomycetidae sp. FL2044]